MPRIIVDDRYCKGCALCVDACPQHIIALDHDRITAKGYHPRQAPGAREVHRLLLVLPDVSPTLP